jgi:hypothetical protein
MLQNPTYDPVALKARLVQQHGNDLGMLVFAAEESRRRTQDEHHAQLTTELAALQADTSALLRAAGERRAEIQARLEAAHADYLKVGAEYAEAESEAQAQIAPLVARSRDVQEQMRSIALPRLSERDLNDLVVYTSMNAALARSADKKFPPAEAPPQSVLGQINATAGDRLSPLRT